MTREMVAIERVQQRVVTADPASPEAEGECVDDPAAVAAAAARRPSVALMPSSCVQKTAEGSHVHVELDGCRGRFGRSTLDGGLDAELTRTAACQLHVDVAGNDDLVANGHPLDYAASADVALVGGGQKLDWHAEWSGVTPKGRDISQETDLNVLADGATSCVDVTGAAHGDVDGHGYDLSIDGLHVCPDLCPSTGTVHATLDGRRRDWTLTVQFDGSTRAHVEGWSGREFDVAMACTPAN